LANGSIEPPLSVYRLIRQRFETLSPRQKDIAFLLTKGLTNGDIANDLGVTVHTIKAHRAEIMRRMEADSFAELVTQIQSLQHPELPVPHESVGPLRIIVVEDDPWYLAYLTENLNERGFTAKGAANSTQFNELWSEDGADIVVLDIELGIGQQDGLAIAGDLRRNSSCGIVMVTAKGDVSDRLKGLEVGADAYFSKPVNINELAITLTNLGRRMYWHPTLGEGGRP
jgi:DNA-binding NarL/FixJ family response regulator